MASTKKTSPINWIVIGLCPVVLTLQLAGAQEIKIVNVIPFEFSAETTQQTEPSIGVNQASGRSGNMVISSFGSLPAPAPQDDRAPFNPLFLTTDGGMTWTNVDNLRYGDATVEWSSKGIAYGARLFDSRGDGLWKNSAGMMRTALLDAPPDDRRVFAGFDTYTTPNLSKPDQPWLDVTTKSNVDRCYMTFNDESRERASWAPGGDGKTASLRYSKDCSGNRPTWRHLVLETETPIDGRNGNPVEVRVSAIPESEKVYVSFMRYQENLTRDLIVRADDNGGDNNFALLTKTVRDDFVPVKYTGVYEDLHSVRTGNLSLAADPSDANNVFVSFAERVDNKNVLRVLRSSNGGDAWANTAFDPTAFVPEGRTYVGADLPSIAFAKSGSTSCIGILYTLFTDRPEEDGMDVQIETHLARSCNSFSQANQITDEKLASFKGLPLLHDNNPYVGDYLDLEGVGDKFFGSFTSLNDPSIPGNFPLGVKYQRRVVCDDGQSVPHESCRLRDMDDNNVNYSMDSFFFSAPAPEPSSLTMLSFASMVLAGSGRKPRSLRTERRALTSSLE